MWKAINYTRLGNDRHVAVVFAGRASRMPLHRVDNSHGQTEFKCLCFQPVPPAVVRSDTFRNQTKTTKPFCKFIGDTLRRSRKIGRVCGTVKQGTWRRCNDKIYKTLLDYLDV